MLVLLCGGLFCVSARRELCAEQAKVQAGVLKAAGKALTEFSSSLQDVHELYAAANRQVPDFSDWALSARVNVVVANLRVYMLFQTCAA